MLHVGLTGNVAAGKSSVAELFRRWGATVHDSDAAVRRLQQPGTPVFAAIRAHFGDGILHPDGTLNRAELRARVLADPAARHALERIVHPGVEDDRQAALAAARAAGARLFVSDIPLLFEVMDPARFDAIVLVDAPESVRLLRLTGDRGLPESEARRLIAAQAPSEGKRARSTHIIDNVGTRTQLEERARAVFTALGALAVAGRA